MDSSLDLKAIKELTKLMRENDLVELEVQSDTLKVKLTKSRPCPTTLVAAQAAPVAMAPVAAAPAPVAAPAADPLAGCRKITAPIPGTVYLKPNPESPAFVKAGDSISDGQVVCLIEAMKVFNEIKCEGCSGTIRKVCVDDGQPVEYGTVLFLVG